MTHSIDRRTFLAAAAGTTLVAGETPPVAFYFVSDTHFLAEKDNPGRLDPRSAKITTQLIATLNRLPGTDIPAIAGGGKVLAPRGAIHGGDCIDTGDKTNVKMQQTEWSGFADTFGLTGKDGQLKVPVYEVHGNHDSPRGDGLAVKKIIARNKTRPDLVNVSANGVHYSWDWSNVHFVNLGIVVGEDASVKRRRRYAPLDSLAFLVTDLKDKVGNSGRPIVITHHIDLLRYSQPLPVEDKRAEKMEWDPADVQGFYAALKGYNVVAILYGHTHARNVLRWDGTPKAARTGIATFNVEKSSHFAAMRQAFFYFEIRGGKVLVREYRTEDGWQTGSWTPQTWTA
ncbi:MAG: hypothetical protein EBV06_01125 [Planctomycetia bacterium]|nr:hypothetical protein [Planctomycetia bacterium]